MLYKNFRRHLITFVYLCVSIPAGCEILAGGKRSATTGTANESYVDPEGIVDHHRPDDDLASLQDAQHA